MNTRKSLISLATAAALAVTLVAPALADTVGVGMNTSVTASVPAVTTQTSASVNASVQTKAQIRAAAHAASSTISIGNIIARSDTEISGRITALTNLDARVQAMKNVSASEKSSFSAEIQTEIGDLASLKVTIDAATDVSILKTEAKSVTDAYRVYMLVIPQGYLESAADRVDMIASTFGTISTKFQTRISEDQSAGKNVATLQASLTDLNAKVADSQVQANAATALVVNLAPDQGVTSVEQSNHAALVAARADIKTAQQDLVAARADAKTIIAGLKSYGDAPTVSASSSASVQ